MKNTKYIYDNTTDTYKKVSLKDLKGKETIYNLKSNKDDVITNKINYMEFSTVNEALDVINDLTALQSEFKDNYYNNIKSLVFQKLKALY